MSKKSEQSAKLLEQIELPHGIPTEIKNASLLQQGLYAVLLRHMPSPRAEAAVQALEKAFPDWNEMRVSQAQEIAVHLAPKGARTPDKLRKHLPAATAVRDYLQEIYQKTHGLDLGELREDALSAGKLVGQMPYLGSIGGTFLLWLAQDRALPVTPGLVRVLDRLGLMARTASPKKARAAMEPIVGKGDPLRFATGFGYVAERWCLVRNPICWECPLREDCPHGRKVVKEWKVQQERLEVQRQKEAARRAAQEVKDRAREERERRRAQEAERRRLEKEARAAERKLAAQKKSGAKPGSKAGAKASGKAAPRPPAKPVAKGGAKKPGAPTVPRMASGAPPKGGAGAKPAPRTGGGKPSAGKPGGGKSGSGKTGSGKTGGGKTGSGKSGGGTASRSGAQRAKASRSKANGSTRPPRRR